MGAQKSDCQKMGAAHDFFFLRAHFLQKKIMGRAPMMRPFFFFWDAHFLKKKIMGEVPIEFVTFSRDWSRPITCGGHFNKIWVKRPFSAHVFFFFETPIFSKKNHGRCAHDAPISFFFPPIFLISLETSKIPLNASRSQQILEKK